jgi:hypothetical protein
MSPCKSPTTRILYLRQKVDFTKQENQCLDKAQAVRARERSEVGSARTLLDYQIPQNTTLNWRLDH